MEWQCNELASNVVSILFSSFLFAQDILSFLSLLRGRTYGMSTPTIQLKGVPGDDPPYSSKGSIIYCGASNWIKCLGQNN